MILHRIQPWSIFTCVLTTLILTGCAMKPGQILDQKLQKAEAYEQRGQWEALDAVLREASILIADHPSLADQQYKVWYYRTKGYTQKAKQTQSISDLMMAIDAGKNAVAAALTMNQAGEIREDEFRQVVQVLLDSIIQGIDMALNAKEFQTAASLVAELQQFSEKARIFPSDLTPIFKASEILYVTAQRMITAVDVPDDETKQNAWDLVDEGNRLFAWASAHDDVKKRASVECLRLNAYWTQNYYEVCDDPLLITPKASTQITAKGLIANPELMGKSLIYLDATAAHVAHETQRFGDYRVLIETRFGSFYLRSGEKINPPVVLFGRFTNIVDIEDGPVVQKAPELTVVVLKPQS